MKILSEEEQTDLYVANLHRFMDISIRDELLEEEKDLLRTELRMVLNLGTNRQEQYVYEYIDALIALTNRIHE